LQLGSHMKHPASQPFLGALLAIALSAGLAHAQDYELRGERLSGRVRVQDDRATFTLLRGKAKETQRLETAAESLAGGGVRIRYEVQVKTKVLQGMVAWFKRPRLNRQAWQPTTRTVVADLLPTGKGGALAGEVDGERQVWTPRVKAQDEWTVLAIPGLSTNNWNKVGIPYLDENLRAARARGLRGRRVGIKTEDGVLKNAAVIKAEIEKEAAAGRKVVFMAHSKGGTDVTAALALYPEVRRHVVGVIAIQPVYGGSYVADLVAEKKVLRGSMALVFEKVFKGQREAVIDLTHTARAAFVAAHPYPADLIPTVVIRSTFDRKLSKSALWSPQKYIEHRHDLASDGLVTLADQEIPGAARTIFLDDLDHFEPGVRLESPHKPIDVTNKGLDALQAVLAKRARPQPKSATSEPTVGRALGR
jgi:pimeloyl-ACP methyl ester carboxylesterase